MNPTHVRRLAFTLACALALGGAFAQPITHVVPDGRPHKFEAREKKFLIDGEPTLLVAGEMHFGRVVPEDWELRIKQAKAMGLNTVSFYLFWNLCEPREGEFTFTGMTDVRRVLKLCQANGLWAILRPGPYCCAEVEYGGIPWWTAKYPDVKIRSTDPQWLAWSRRYIEQVAKQVGDLQVTKGGPLLMVQLDNEYGMVSGGNFDYLKALQKIFTDVGFEVPLFTCDPFLMPERIPGALPAGVLRGRNGLRSERDYQQTIAAIGDAPPFVPELYTAWFSGWGQPLATRNASLEGARSWTSTLLDKKVSFCYYMFFGGTTFGFYTGSNEYLPLQTCYDYSAPIDEAGRTTEKFRVLRQLFIDRLGVTPPPAPPEPAVISLPAITLDAHQSLLDTLPATPTRVSAQPLTMEQLDQDYGFVLYRKKFSHGIKGTLELKDARDYTIVMVNGRTIGRVFIGLGLDSNKFTLDESRPVTLDLLVHNLGRISVITAPRSQDRARKGLVGGATLDGQKLTDWENYSLPCASIDDIQPSAAPHTGPTFYRGTFNVEKVGGTFLDLRNWGFGAVWVNGHHLGRYWDRGGVRSLFLPAAWLHTGRNHIVVLELHDAPKAAEISGDTKIIEEAPVPFAVRLDRANLAPAISTPR